MALLDVQVATLANQAMNYLAGGMVPKRLGNSHPNIVPYQAFPTADGYIILAVGNDGQFARFCKVAGLDDLAIDERYATNAGRVRHREALVPQIAETIRTRASAEWLSALEAEGVPCGPINTLDQVFADPQVVHRGLKVSVPHPTAGHVDLVGSPMRFSGTPVEYHRAPPTLGQDTEDVLADLGVGANRLAALREKGIV